MASDEYSIVLRYHVSRRMCRARYIHTHTHTHLLPLYACLAISWGCENGCAPVADEEHVELEKDDELPAVPVLGASSSAWCCARILDSESASLCAHC